MTVSYPTFDEIVPQARPYPTQLLKDAESGLCLFSAAFMGHNEAIHFALLDVPTTCVDIDSDKLEVMADLYPENWKFICRDAWDFAEAHARTGDKWDVVSVDTFRGNATERSLTTLPLWCSIANRAVIATLEAGQTYEVPEGWTASEHFQRNSTVFWLVLTPNEDA